MAVEKKRKKAQLFKWAQASSEADEAEGKRIAP
jgi:hypothetical protein